MEMLKVDNITRVYPNGAGIFDISFSINECGIYGLLGENGAGKSTLMSIITGFLSAGTGEVSICGNDILKAPIAAKKNIGYLPEVPPVYEDMTVREYLKFAAELKGISKSSIQNNIERVIDDTKLEPVKDRLIKNLSKGYKQRVGLAQAILADFKVLILDEPMSGLDPVQIAETRKLILSLKDDHVIILSSHILSEISDLCEHVFIMSKGHLVYSGLLKELETEDKSLEDAFLEIISQEYNELNDDITDLKNPESDEEILEDKEDNNK